MMAAMTVWRRHLSLERSVWFIALVLALGVVWLPAQSAHAQWDPAQQFEEGLAHFDKGEHREALPFFRNAYERTQSPNARLYVALCLSKIGKSLEAYHEMRGTLDLASELALKEEKYNQTRDTAAAELALLEKRVGKIVVAFSDGYPGAEVRVNGQLLEVEEHGVPQAVEPGDIEIVAGAPGMKLFTTVVAVSGGELQTVAIALEPGADDQADEGGGVNLSVLQIAGIGVAGAGVVGLVVFAITGSMASSKFDELEQTCPKNTTPTCSVAQFEELSDSGRTLETVANVMLGVGIALSAGGAGMIIFGGDDDAGDGAEARALVLPLPGGAGLSVGGRF
jgi:hypothetical protein